jgi:hypothetical protein
MDDIDKLVCEALADFRKVAALADTAFIADSITVEITRSPHRQPKGLPAGKIAVYAFFLNGQALKVGKAGPSSNARYTSQHYNPKSAGSNLARSILANPAKVGALCIDALGIGDWIKGHTDRLNLLAPVSLGNRMLSLLESFLHVRWRPVFEGKGNDD